MWPTSWDSYIVKVSMLYSTTYLELNKLTKFLEYFKYIILICLKNSIKKYSSF